MKVKVYPSQVSGQVVIPPSKSMSHRAIIAAALAPGKSVISNVAYSDDIKITIAGMEQLGANITCLKDSVIVEGVKQFNHLENNTVFCKESGSTLRFFIPIFSLCNQVMRFTGENRLLKRPQAIYEKMFTQQGIPYSQDDERIEIGGCLQPGNYELDGNVSSQFISGLLFALPLLQGDSTITIKEPYESRSYVDLTLEILHLFGIEANYTTSNVLAIKGNQTYQAHDYRIEGDYSQLGFFAVLGAINHDITCLGLKHDSKQGDRQIVSILQNAGANITLVENGYHIQKSVLQTNEIDLQDCPDLGPILSVMALFTPSTRIYNASRLRYKESDRLQAMEDELLKVQANVRTTESEMIIKGNQTYTSDTVLSGHKDHRIVMSLSVLATCLTQPVVIEEAEYINKSYPTFFTDLQRLGVKVEVLHD